MPDAILIGLSGLNAQQRAMEVSSHNIANATTPGYSRQRVELGAQLPESINPGQLGRGVSISAIRRAVDNLLLDRLRVATSEHGRLDGLVDQLKNIELAFNEPGDGGLSRSTADLFSAMEALGNNAESTALRSTTAQALTSWSDQVRSLSERLTNLRDDLRGGIESEVVQINDYLREIASLNQEIRSETNLGNNPNDLLDRRDELARQLSESLAVRTRIMPDGGMLVDSDGALLVGLGGAVTLSTGLDSSGAVELRLPGGGILVPQGGKLAGLAELQKEILPGLMDELDVIAGTMIRALNGLHSTSTSHAYRAEGLLGETSIPFANGGLDLDDPLMAPVISGGDGIPTLSAPNFRDVNGTVVAKNLTINVMDHTTGFARKHVVRFDPSIDSGRSLKDLVSAINTGKGGGFQVIPATAGIPGVVAQAIAIDGSFQLRLNASPDHSIDFSQALDLSPSAQSWASPSISLAAAGTDLAFAGQRIGIRAVSATDVEVFTRDPVSGQETIHPGGVAVTAIPGPLSLSVGGITLNFPPLAGTFRTGDAFAVNVDDNGVPDAVTNVNTTWVASDATFAIKGRYSGELSHTPGRDWGMRIINGGVIGATVGTAPPGNPPLVEFSYWTGEAAAPELRSVQVLLDDSKPAGRPIEIADGVYAVFSNGVLTTAASPGLQAVFQPDSQPDQAGILPALGINNLLSGSRAADIALGSRIAEDADQLSVGQTRAQGDNSRLQELIAVRQSRLFANGAFNLEDTYQGMLTGIGSRVQQNERSLESSSILRQSLEGRRSASNGVNIDEEVGNLVLQQQAYSAAARVVTTARENIQTLLDILR